MQKQLHISIVATLIEKVVPIENSEEAACLKKPKQGTGLWTSSWREETQDTAWIEWCRGEDFGEPDSDYWHLLTPRSDVRLYTIDSTRDLSRLLKTYPWEGTPMLQEYRRSMQAYGFKGYSFIDFERLAKDYDGLHLTEKGNTQTHLSYPHDLNSWDSESTLWFRWCFDFVEVIRKPAAISTTVNS